jgi:Domain of unknown function (DUF4129)
MVGERAPKAPRRGTAQRPTGGRRIWPLLAAVVLLALVAVGSLRGAPGSGAGTPRFPSALLQTLGLLALVTVLAGLAVAAWTLLPGKRQVARRPRNPLFMPLMLIGFVLLLALLRRLGWLDRLRFLPGLGPGPSPSCRGVVPTGPDGRLTGGDPGWIPFVVVGVLLAGLAAAIMLRSEQARRRRAALDGPGRQLAELLQGTLADLEDEPDPRRAVIAAWIRMEGGLAAAGLPRHAAEAPLEYVARVLEQANVQPASVRRLADLFERAKFSQHTIDEAMRAAAIEAVTTIRAELEAEQARALQAAREQRQARERRDAERSGMVGRP